MTENLPVPYDGIFVRESKSQEDYYRDFAIRHAGVFDAAGFESVHIQQTGQYFTKKDKGAFVDHVTEQLSKGLSLDYDVFMQPQKPVTLEHIQMVITRKGMTFSDLLNESFPKKDDAS